MKRFVPTTDQDRKTMLDAIGISSAEELFSDIPEQVRLKRRLALPEPLSEPELAALMRRLSTCCANSEDYTYFLGAGCYDHFIPSVVRHMVSRSEFYTAYTPYQPEVSQGTLQAMFEFQTMLCQLTGMEVANASMYDCATAVAEAALMARRIMPKRGKIVVGRSVHPDYRAVLRSYTRNLGLEVLQCGFAGDGRVDLKRLEGMLDGSVAAVIVQSPNFFGVIEELDAIGQACKESGSIFIVVVSEALSLGILKPPGAYGADIVVGQGQSLGIPMSFGGPHLGLFATRERYIRQMPGRIVGQTVDRRGRRGFVMTLATREQHIRRARATSNICTNHQLCALAATVYMSVLGKQGMREVARLNILKAAYAKSQLAKRGVRAVLDGPSFNEFVIQTRRPVSEVNASLLSSKIVGGLAVGHFYEEFDDRTMLVCVTENASRDAIDAFCEEVSS